MALFSERMVCGLAPICVYPSRYADPTFCLENHIPTYRYCAEILSETLDMSPLFLETYTNRIRERFENDDELAGRLPDLMASGDLRVFTLSRLLERRTEHWVPDFDL